eukprot:2414047-Alexandrium_andersonii.AAC.1
MSEALSVSGGDEVGSSTTAEPLPETPGMAFLAQFKTEILRGHGGVRQYLQKMLGPVEEQLVFARWLGEGR